MKHFIVTIKPERPQIIDVKEHDATPLELDDFYSRIDGMIEIVPLPAIRDLRLVIDDCGKLKRLPLNICATELAELFPMDEIVGPAVIAKQCGEELMPINEDELAELYYQLFNIDREWGVISERH